LDKGDNFVGNLFTNKLNMGVALLKEGLASLRFSADRNSHALELLAAEKEAKDAKRGMWEHWVEPTAEELLAKEAAGLALGDDESPMAVKEDEYVRMKPTEILNASSFYAQIVSDKHLSEITERLAALALTEEFPAPPTEPFLPRSGTLCAALFTDDNWYRVKVEHHDKKTDEFTVFFIDFGNHDMLLSEHLRALPTDLAKTPAQAYPCMLAGVATPRNKEYADNAHDALSDLVYGRVLLGKVEYIDRSRRLHVTLISEEQPISVNATIIRDGYSRVVDRPDRRILKLVDELKKEQEHALNNHYNIWEYGDVSDEENDEDAPKPKGPL